MKMNKKFGILTIGLVLLILSFVAFKYVFAGTLNWKEYSNPEVNFSFKYPSNWYSCEEFYKKLDQRFVHISDKPIDCTNLSFSDNSRYLTVYDTGERTSEIDTKDWLDIYNKKADEYEKRNLLDGGLPSVDGSSWEFVRYVDGLLRGQKNNSVVEVMGFGDYPEFITINKGGVYSFKFLPMTGTESLPLKLILKTLEFK